VLKALADKTVKSKALLSHDAKKAKAAPREVHVLLAEDIEATAGDDRILEAQLRAARTPREPAADATRLVKGLAKPLHAAFKAALAARIEARRLPPGLGALPGKKPLLFLVEDAILIPRAETPAPHGARAAAAPARHAPTEAAASPPEPELVPGPKPEPDGFAARFDAAFTALDRAAGGTNYVPLRALREALPDVPRAAFDGALADLRRARRYAVDPSEGRHHQLGEADRAAGITEGGRLLVYVARRDDA
jgi:hypothetical protein